MPCSRSHGAVATVFLGDFLRSWFIFVSTRCNMLLKNAYIQTILPECRAPSSSHTMGALSLGASKCAACGHLKMRHAGRTRTG